MNSRKDPNRVSKLRLALVGLLTAATGLPLSIGKTDTRATPRTGPVTITASQSETKQAPAQAPATGGQSINIIRGLDGLDPTYLPLRSGGNTPKDWGMSRACARMVRKNKLRRLGIGGDRR